MRPLEEYNEQELLQQLLTGNQQALGALYYRYIKPLKRFVTAIVKSPALADDAVHDTFVRLWENRARINPGLPLKPYLFTIARRQVLNLLKRARQEEHILTEMARFSAVKDHGTEQVLDFRETDALIREAVEQLPRQCREVFIRCRLQGLTYKQAAEELGITESGVNKQMVKAIRSIREFVSVRQGIALLLLAISGAV